MRTYTEALEVLRSRVRPLGKVEVPLDQALGRVAAEAVRAPSDQPPWANAAMDGYAVRSADVAVPEERPALRVIGQVAAGQWPDRTVEPGTAVRIFTGAPVPPGADAVVPQEDVVETPEGIQIRRPVSPGENVRPPAEDFSAGTCLIPVGRYITPADIALAATVGRDRLWVYRVPRALVLASGQELAEPGQPLERGRIYDSNSYFLQARLRRLGIPVERWSFLPDRWADVRSTLARAFDRFDVVITTGGVSVGEYDLIRKAWESLGLETLIAGVAIKPGKPLWVGTADGRWAFGLPGNPASAYVCLEAFVYPWLWWVQGFPGALPYRFPVTLGRAVQNPGGRTFFLRCRLHVRPEGWYAEPAGPQGSHIVRTTARSQALVVVEPNARLEAGAVVGALIPEAHPLDLLLAENSEWRVANGE
ncbi:Molybdopterin molybdenumtransferase [bacterium HR11]|nr:Molybdopterin molybdenumtransferase [bacterium HR11]